MATLGQQLKQLREERGVKLHDIADSTHIGMRFLQAIENDTYDILPGGVFNRAFVRKFARYVGFDEEQAIKLYEEQLEEQGGEPQRRYQYGIEDFEAKPSSGNGLLLSFVALLILGALLYAAYLIFAPDSSGAGPGPSSNANAPTPAPAPTATPATGAAAGPALEQQAGPMRVQLTATGEEVWVRVRADGGKIERIFLQPDQPREFSVNDRIGLSIARGKLPALKITINGRTVNYSKLTPSPKSAITYNVVITKDNYQQSLD